jgi:hypothetical protein
MIYRLVKVKGTVRSFRNFKLEESAAGRPPHLLHRLRRRRGEKFALDPVRVIRGQNFAESPPPNGCRIKSGMTAAVRHDGNGPGIAGALTPSFRDLIAESSAESPPPMDAGSSPA